MRVYEYVHVHVCLCVCVLSVCVYEWGAGRAIWIYLTAQSVGDVTHRISHFYSLNL